VDRSRGDLTELRASVFELAKVVEQLANSPVAYIYAKTLSPGARAELLVKELETQRFYHDGIEAGE